jgi:hypothetical protein
MAGTRTKLRQSGTNREPRNIWAVENVFEQNKTTVMMVTRSNENHEPDLSLSDRSSILPDSRTKCGKDATPHTRPMNHDNDCRSKMNCTRLLPRVRHTKLVTFRACTKITIHSLNIKELTRPATCTLKPLKTCGTIADIKTCPTRLIQLDEKLQLCPPPSAVRIVTEH